MKKIYLLLAVLCMAFLSSIPAAADDDWAFVEKDGIHYSLKGKNKVYVINGFNVFSSQIDRYGEYNYSWLSGDINIPSKVYFSVPLHAIYSNQEVVAIENSAFSNMTASVNITLPSTIKEIGRFAFLNATGLKSIRLNEGITEIGYWAFSGCTNLTSIGHRTKRIGQSKGEKRGKPFIYSSLQGMRL